MQRIAIALLTATWTLAAEAQQPLYDLRSPVPGDEMGAAVVPLGDINGDGRGDFAVGGPEADGQQPDAGIVWAYSGADATVLWTFPGFRTADRTGASLAPIGDANGDGVKDLIVGAPGFDDPLGGLNAGAAWVISGADGSYIRQAYGNQPGEAAGFAVTGMGDDHYAVSAPFWEPLGSFTTSHGRVYVYHTPTGSLHYTATGSKGGDQFGYALGDSGDVNGDGFSDLLVGSPGHDKPGFPFSIPDAGRVDCLTALLGSTAYSIQGWGGRFGAALSGGLDLNGDGLADFVGGAPTESNGGRVHAISGAFGNPILWSITGTASGDEMGAAVALFPDATGDGLPDVMVGAPGEDVGSNVDAGSASLVSGANGQIQGTMYGYQPGDRMGDAVGWGGFVNQDGYADPFGCAPKSNTPSTGGWVRTSLGNAPAPTFYCTAKVNSAGCTPYISYTGAPAVSVSANYFKVIATNVLENKAGIMIWSTSAASTPFYGGTLCVKAPIKRTPVQTASTQTLWPTLPCKGFYEFNFNEAYRSSQGIGAGDTVYMQYWSRDSGFAAPNSIGLTGGLQVLVHP